MIPAKKKKKVFLELIEFGKGLKKKVWKSLSSVRLFATP